MKDEKCPEIVKDYPEFTKVGVDLDDIMRSMLAHNVIESTTIYEEPFTEREFEIRFRLLKKN